MKAALAGFLVALAALIPLDGAGQATSTPLTAETARVIVKLRADAMSVRKEAQPALARPVSHAQLLGARLGLSLRAGASVSDRTQVVIGTGMTSAALAQRLSQESDVEYAVPDQRRHRLAAPNDPLYAAGVGGNGPAVGQWYLRAPADPVKSSINAEPAWAITTGNPGVVVADIDTGVRFDHPDLLSVAAGGNLLPGYDMVSDVDTANDGDGRDPDASDPGDWVTQQEISQRGGPFYQCDTSPEDSSWHGTQVSGLIAALTNNGVGMASVGRTVRVLPVRVLGKCGGFDSDVIAGMRWAAGLSVPGVPLNAFPARVINVSLGGDGACPPTYADAISEITAVGTVIVVAAGNSAGHETQAPGNCNGVIGVAGLRHVGTKVGFSDLGFDIALAAPGGNCVNTDAASPCLYPILTTSNSGTTTPAASIYTDSFNASVGTSFSTPLVSGTAALMLSVQSSLTPLQVRILLQATARRFPTSGSDSAGPVPQCMPPQSDLTGAPIDQLECYCTTDTCGAGMLDAGAAVTAAASGVPPASVQTEGMWWDAVDAESGTGINFTHQGDVIFATWFTYDPNGNAWWLSMTANKTGSNPETYSGTLIETRGPPFSAVPFDPALVTRTVVGFGTLSFADLNHGTFASNVKGLPQTKPIARLAFDTLPRCTYSAQPNFDLATNYQGLWSVVGNTESGWGLNLTHQGDTLFGSWYTYGADGSAIWLSVTFVKTGPSTYGGQLIRTTGPAFGSQPFVSAAVTRTVVGLATLLFTTGNAATFSYTVDGLTQTKHLARFLFAPPAGTLCQ